MGLQEISSESMDCNDVVQSWSLVHVVMNLQVPWNVGNILASWQTVGLSQSTLVRGFTIPAHLLQLDFTNTVNNINLHSAITLSSTANCVTKLQPQFFPCSPLGTCVSKILKSTYHKGPYFLRKIAQQRAQNLAALSNELATRLFPSHP
jgi:hypothetical protein